MSEKIPKLEDGLLFDRAKLLIMTSLASVKEAMSFNELLEATALTKGNLSSHLQRLEAGRLVKINKYFLDRKPLTTVELTSKGRQTLKGHLESLQAIIKNVKF